MAYARGDHAPTVACFGSAATDSRFALASLTKPLVAAACLVAWEEGTLDIDAPLAEHLLGVDQVLTLRDVLSHASGLPSDDANARRVQLDPNAEWRDVATAYRCVAPVAPRRTRRIYSNVGYALAAAALEQATGMSYRTYVTESVLAPLGMSNTTFGASGTLAFADPATGTAAVILGNRGTYTRWMLEAGGWSDICAALVA